MRILVTGAAGFIGAHVAAALGAAGHEVVVLDVQPAPGRTATGAACGEWVHGDLRDEAGVENALRGVDAVSHQAAVVGHAPDIGDAPAYVSSNNLGTAVLLAAMARVGVANLVLAGSMVVYGEGRYTCAEHGDVRPAPRRPADLDAGMFDPPCPTCAAPLRPGLVGEEAPTDPRGVYAATKLAQEHLAAAWARATGGRAIALRYHNVYGPGMPRDTPYAGVASFFRSALARGAAPAVFEDGRQRRDFVHVRDIASANRAALDVVADRPEGALRAYNAGSGTPHTVGDMAEALARACGGPAPRTTGEYRLGDVRHITASSRRLVSELGWEPEVGFAEGMAEFAAAPPRGASDAVR